MSDPQQNEYERGSARPMNPERGGDSVSGKGGRPGVGPSDSQPTVERIAYDFALIPFDNHEGKLLAQSWLTQRRVLEELVAAVGSVESGGAPIRRLEAALAEAREVLGGDTT